MTYEDRLSLLPPSWQRGLRGLLVEPILRGMSGVAVYRILHPASGKLYLKVCDSAGLADLRNEVKRTNWLTARGVRVPSFLRIFDNGRMGAVLMTAISGCHPEQVRRPTAAVIGDLGRGLHALHAIPTMACPFDETAAVRLKRARKAIKHGNVKPEHFAKRNRALTPELLYKRLAAAALPDEDIVLIHGDARFDNVLIDDEGKIGFIDCGHAGRGDRYIDLEAVITDINEYFGAKWVKAFVRCYGQTELDSTKLRFFSDLYEFF